MPVQSSAPFSSSPSSGESTLSINRAALLRALGRYLPWSEDPGEWDDNQKLRADDIIKSGERMLYHPERLPGEQSVHTWSFLYPVLTLPINAPYSTGTVAIVSGVVTLSGGGTWPSWAASGWISVDGSLYEVATRTSNSVIVLSDTSVTVSSGATYKLEQWEYDLPSGFAHFLDPQLSFSPDNQRWYPLDLAGPGYIHQRRQTSFMDYASDEQPFLAAVNPRTRNQATGQRFELIIWPSPASALTIKGPYFLNPFAITVDDPYPLGGEQHAETLLEAVLAAAEIHMNDERTIHRETFKERLWASVALDRRTHTPKFFG
jgi:hypothetical protein